MQEDVAIPLKTSNHSSLRVFQIHYHSCSLKCSDRAMSRFNTAQQALISINHIRSTFLVRGDHRNVQGIKHLVGMSNTDISVSSFPSNTVDCRIRSKTCTQTCRLCKIPCEALAINGRPVDRLLQHELMALPCALHVRNGESDIYMARKPVPR